MKQSKELTAFYNAYNNWLEAGAPVENEYNFVRYTGLCDNLYVPTGYNLKEMKEQFEEAGLCIEFPFGVEKYQNGRLNGTQHLDPNRIKWVKAHLTEEVDEKFELV